MSKESKERRMAEPGIIETEQRLLRLQSSLREEVERLRHRPHAATEQRFLADRLEQILTASEGEKD